MAPREVIRIFTDWVNYNRAKEKLVRKEARLQTERSNLDREKYQLMERIREVCISSCSETNDDKCSECHLKQIYSSLWKEGVK